MTGALLIELEVTGFLKNICWISLKSARKQICCCICR